MALYRAENICEVPVASINESVFQDTRIHHLRTPQVIQELAASIEDKGQLQPIKVIKMEGGGFGLMAGKTRLLAIRDVLKWPTIKADVFDNTDQFKKEMEMHLSFIESKPRQDLTEWEKAEGITNLLLKATKETPVSKEYIDFLTAAMKNSAMRPTAWVRLKSELEQTDDGKFYLADPKKSAKYILGVYYYQGVKMLRDLNNQLASEMVSLTNPTVDGAWLILKLMDIMEEFKPQFEYHGK